MCELLGLSFQKPVKASISLNVFQEGGIENPDGWGVAFYRKGSLQIIKEASPAQDSTLYDFVEQNAVSKVYISHLRRSTTGIRSYLNTHPFYRNATVGRERVEVAFAHNGTVINFEEFPLGADIPLGQTDSEYVFCHLLNMLTENADSAWRESTFKLLQRHLQKINSGKNTINCLLSDGRHLLCYSDINDHNSGLRYSSYNRAVNLADPEKSLGEIRVLPAEPSNENELPLGFIVTTRTMARGDWIEVSPGELVVFKNGNLLYSS